MSEEEKPTEWTASTMGRKGGSVQSPAQRAQQQARRQSADARRPQRVCTCDAGQRTGDDKGRHRRRCSLYPAQAQANYRAEQANHQAEKKRE